MATYSIELCRLCQERPFEVFLVHRSRVYTQNQEHLAGILNTELVDELAPPVSHHETQQRVSKVVSDATVPDNLKKLKHLYMDFYIIHGLILCLLQLVEPW